jgi:hypothetical protein
MNGEARGKKGTNKIRGRNSNSQQQQEYKVLEFVISLFMLLA